MAGRGGKRRARRSGWRFYARSDPLPRTQSGKVLKRDLRPAIASELRDG